MAQLILMAVHGKMLSLCYLLGYLGWNKITGLETLENLSISVWGKNEHTELILGVSSLLTLWNLLEEKFSSRSILCLSFQYWF